ncbi:MAG: TonB-dependent receptor [Woeseiaceae bacterium]
MRNKRTILGVTHNLCRKLTRFGAFALLVLALPVAGFAQETSGSVRGTVLSPSGTPESGASVTVTDTRTSASRSATTSADGTFNVSGLAIGGPFEISVRSSEYKSALVTDVYTSLSEAADFNITLEAGAIEEIVVTASQNFRVGAVALGPNATFSLEQLQAAPAINRNITDVIRADSRIYVDESRGDINAVQCAGKNSRFNSLTVDGVRMNDSFGLNSNGYPTERMPFSFDAINQVAVELAPFDVQYGGFSACNINAVTKSGRNDFFGSAFFDYTDDSLRGDSLEGDDIQTGSFDEQRYGFSFGGPIVRDKLFFFAAYEKLDGVNLFDRGPIGSGAVNEVDVTQAELDEIVDIAQTLYLYDPGPIPSSMDHEDEKLLVKIDWNINEQNRLAFTYTYNDGENFTESDSETTEFEFENHLYERGAELNSYAGTLYSDWTDRFSTELRVSYLEIDNRQLSVGGTDFGEIRVELPNVDVYLGGDDSRQANKLDYDVTGFRLKGTYDFDRHSITGGIEYETLDIFNMFVQHTETEIRFDGMQNFRDGFADAIYYNNAPSNVPEDAAAVWGYDTTTVFIQDEFELADRWTIVAGLRYDYYTTDDAPPENTDFTADYGFPNTATLDGEGLVQPRLGFTFDWTADTTLRGGAGLYSGGNPNVWLSNNYSANNVQQFGQRGRSFGYTDGTRSLFDADVVHVAIEPNAPAGAGAGWGIQEELFDAVAQGVGDNFEINYLDPNFELPSEWKFALGVTHMFPRDYVFTADFLFTRLQDSAIVLHGDLDQVGTDADGYPIYDSVREASFVLTNSNTDADAMSFSLGLSKAFDNGFDFSVGYTYNDAEDVSPMTSSVAFSNYQNRAFFDPQEDVASLSNYNIEHRFTFTTTWRMTLFDRLPTIISLFGQTNTGRPYSYAFDGTASPYGFTPFLDFRTNVLEPGVARNSQEGSSWTKIDFRFDIGIPIFRDEDRLAFFMVIDNLTNLLNDDWGVLRQHAFPRTVAVGTPEPRIGDASRYEIRFGVKYDF